MLTLSSWGAAATRHADTIGWVHKTCGERVQGRMVCGYCQGVLVAGEVERVRASARRIQLPGAGG